MQLIINHASSGRASTSASRQVRPRSAILLFGLLTAVSLTGCSGLAAVNLLTPNAAVAAQDVRYSAETDLRLDVYNPERGYMAEDELVPVVVFLYGGGWQEGTRQRYKFVASGLTSSGYVVVIPDMRKYPEVSFPEFANDAAAAVSWALKNVAQYGGDPDRVFLMGHSSGAHVAALLNYDERYLQPQPGSPRVCGLIGLAGPYDFLPLVSPTLQKGFPQTLRQASQPINFIEGNEPPALLIHGLQDQTVKPRNSAALAEQVTAAGGSVRLNVYDKKQHAALVLALSSSFDFLAPVIADTQEFINAQACGPHTANRRQHKHQGTFATRESANT